MDINTVIQGVLFVSGAGGYLLVSQQSDNTDFFYLIAQQHLYAYTTPRVDLSMSYDGGASFGSSYPYVLNPIGQRKNRLNWWQCGIANDAVPQFKFWGMGRFVATDGMANLRR